MIEYITDDLVSLIMEDFKIPIIEAIQWLYTSENIETGLYLESPSYVYGIYKSEKENGRIIQQEI